MKTVRYLLRNTESRSKKQERKRPGGEPMSPDTTDTIRFIERVAGLETDEELEARGKTPAEIARKLAEDMLSIVREARRIVSENTELPPSVPARGSQS
jgi:hypothetical protein